MLIGYSFWGFLGPGITDTPDGGRSHRATLVDGLLRRGHDVVFLQVDRDRLEAGHDLTDTYRWDSGFPQIDVLFLEWRWPISGRNTTDCGTAGHTCDLHRQAELLAHYTDRGVRTIVWDKDRRLPAEHPLRTARHVVICEAALYPSHGSTRLLFPVDDSVLDAVDPTALARGDRDLDLVYVGNQYDRDDAFSTYFLPAARVHPRHLVAGKWTDTTAWPRVRFVGRVGFTEVELLHRRAVSTILLLPERYAAVGQMTQRIIEAVTTGCLPLTPTNIRGAGTFVPKPLLISSGEETAGRVAVMRGLYGRARHVELLADCVARLEPFRLSRQLDVLDMILESDRHASTVTA